MPTLDIAMPIALFVIVAVALYLNNRVEPKLKGTVEQKEFRTRDVITLVGSMAIVITIISVASILNPAGLFTYIFMTVFMLAYSILLFTIAYVFSDGAKKRAQSFSLFTGLVSIAFLVVSLLSPFTDAYTIFRATAFAALAVFCFATIIVDQKRSAEPKPKERWWLAVQPAALFILLFVFFNRSVLYDAAFRGLWSPILLDVFAFTFALLIILYLSTLFTWKTAVIFAAALTILDIILVFSGPMGAAARTFTDAGLPVLTWLPNVPLIPDTTNSFGVAFRGLGLGDFFFTGVLVIQTFKKFGKKIALIALTAMTISFGIWESFLTDMLNALKPVLGDIGGFPGTLMIITGWIPVVAVALFLDRKKQKNILPSTSVQPEKPANEKSENDPK